MMSNQAESTESTESTEDTEIICEYSVFSVCFRGHWFFNIRTISLQ